MSLFSVVTRAPLFLVSIATFFAFGAQLFQEWKLGTMEVIR
jgi:hypothetical protein